MGPESTNQLKGNIMTRKAKTTKTTKTAAVAKPEIQKAKLTKRNATPTTALLDCTDKVVRARAAHTKAAWEQIAPLLPAPAAELAALPIFEDERYRAALVSGPAFVSYMQRRGHLTIVK
jgi:hypothetical protein